MPISEDFNEDNMIGMARYPDKFFDLAIVDPPYGLGEDGGSNHSRGSHRPGGKKNTKGTAIPSTIFKPKEWDSEPPPAEYFTELFRVSKNQIIWGANHFISRIPFDSSCWIVWDKVNGDSDFADCELAWTSFKTAVRQFRYVWNGMLQGSQRDGSKAEGNKRLYEPRIHPTQKPTKLYRWILNKYANPGDKILDTHRGSASSRIAAYMECFDYWGWELDKEYYNDGQAWFNKATSPLKLFLNTLICKRKQQALKLSRRNASGSYLITKKPVLYSKAT